MVARSEAASEILFRKDARANLQDFICYINPEYIVSDFSRTVCRELDSFLLDMVAGLRPVLILGAPPQHGKSDIVSRYLPAFVFGKFTAWRVAGLSYAKDLASDMNRDVQRIMMGDEYKRLFPESSLNRKHVVNRDLEAKRNSEAFELVGSDGSYIGQGVGGPLTGKKVDLGIIDDPIKNAQEALSATTKNSLWNWYTSTFLTRLSRYSGQIIMATRWALDDLSGRIAKSTPRAKVLTFPAIDENGEALVPELHPIDKLLETKATLSEYFWSAMYQQSPVVAGGNMFKGEWWQYYDKAPLMQWRSIYADTAMKTKEHNDNSVLACWGKSFSGQAYLIDILAGKWEAPELLVNARAFWTKHNADKSSSLRSLQVEDKASGTGLIQTLRREGIPVIPVQRVVDKITRGNDAAPLIQSGNVFLPASAPWLSDFLLEHAQFPNSTRDDRVDTTMDAVKDILQPSTFTSYGDIL